MNRIQLSLIWLVFFSTSLFAQNKTNDNQISFITENDSYLLIAQDQYYTNGLKIKYHRCLSKTNTSKKIISFAFAHEIYNGFTASIDSLSYHDRPFSGYVNTKLGYQQILKKKNTIFIELEIGYIGKKTKAKELQEFIHHSFGLYSIKGWEHQLNESYSYNINTKFEKEIRAISSAKKKIQLTSSINLGTRKTNLSFGTRGMFSFKKNLISLNKSTLNNFNIGEKKEAIKSFFIFIEPRISYYLFDATIQGGVNSSENPITFDIIPFRFEFETGLEYQKNAFVFKLKYHFTTKETTHRFNTAHTYGSLNLGFQF